MIGFLVSSTGRMVQTALVLLIGSIGFCSPGMAQSSPGAAVAQVRTVLAQRSFWGRDYPLLIASIPGWARIQEKNIVIAPDVIFGGTPFRALEEAETQAKSLAASVAADQTVAGDFVELAAQGRRELPGKIASRPYKRGASYRVVVGLGSDFLRQDLTITEVQRILGKEEKVGTETEDVGEGRPIIYTDYVYAGGALIFRLSSYAPAPDQVFRIVLDIPSSMEAIGATR
jgi:hypothetical protein